MLRFLNVVAILALIGSGFYAYSIKYQTMLRAEQINKMKREAKSERDAIAVLRAEWAFMTRPERVQDLADKYLDLKALAVTQIATAQSLPEKPERVDSIGRKLDALGLGRRGDDARRRGGADDAERKAAMTTADTVTKRARGLRGRLDGLLGTSLGKTAPRMRIVAAGFFCLYVGIGARLVIIGFKPDPTTMRRASGESIAASRPDVLDRNGEILATDVKTMSVFAEPRRLIDKDEATELLTAVLPNVDARELRDRLASRKGFVWVKREVTPKQRDEVFHLGLPGVGLVPENKRVYPNGPAAAHVLGYVNIDNGGIAGIEKYIDGQGLADLHDAGFSLTPEELKPIALSIDIKATHAVRDELREGRRPLQGQGRRRGDHGRQHRRGDRARLAAGLRSEQAAGHARSELYQSHECRRL